MALNKHDEKARIEARRKYFSAFNDTMIRIWKERISLLGVIDSGALYRSVMPLKQIIADDKATQAVLSQEFLTYGLWQNFGTGRETKRGNKGDIGRPKVRQARRWFDKKYYSSVMNLRDFFCESLSTQYLAMMTNALDDNLLRRQATK